MCSGFFVFHLVFILHFLTNGISSEMKNMSASVHIRSTRL